MNRLILVSLLFPLLLTGCWDRVEIEEVGFVIGVAFDPVKKEERTGEEEEQVNNGQGRKFTTTFHVAIPSAFTTAGEGGSQQGKAFFNISSSDPTNLKMIRNVNARRSRTLNFEHLKVIIINEELAKKVNIGHLLDLYTRDQEMRRKTHVLVSKGDAKNIYKDKLPLEDMPGISVEMIDENERRVLQMISTKDIGKITDNIVGKQSFLIARVVKHGREGIKVSGAAIFSGKKNKMIGWLGEEYIKGYNWIMGDAKNGILESTYKGGPFVFETLALDAKVTYERINDQDIFNIHIRAEGNFAESWLNNVEIDYEENIKKFESIVADKIEKQAIQSINIMQNEYHCDIFEFGKKVKQKNYKYWQEVKEKWEEENGGFTRAKFNVEAQVQIRQYMTHERLE